MSTRRGQSLVECLVAMTLFGTAFGAVALTLHALQRSECRVRDALDADREWERLSAQLREDAHQATSAVAAEADRQPESASELQLALPAEQTVKYTVQAARVERLLRHQQAVLHRETFRLPAATRARWQVQTDRHTPLVSLRLDPEPGRWSEGIGVGPCRLDAAVRLIGSSSPVARP